MRFSTSMLLCGLLIAGVALSEERSPSDAPESNARIGSSRASEMQRGEIMRGDMQRDQRSPLSTRDGDTRLQRNRFPDAADANSRRFGDRSSPAPSMNAPATRDPRVSSYRTRVQPQEFRGGYVPQDMQRAIQQAQTEHGGKVLSADRIRYRGQDTYRVKLLTPGGRVRVVQLSEKTKSERDIADQDKEEE